MRAEAEARQAWPEDRLEVRAAGWRHVRPMPAVRSAHELSVAETALHSWDVADPRLKLFRGGVALAWNWVSGRSGETPVDGVLDPGPAPAFGSIFSEYGRAALVSAGARRFARMVWCDAGRLVGHGVETFLLWYLVAEVPTSGVLDQTASLEEALAPLGDIGCDAPGLYGPGVSGARFPDLPGALVRVDPAGNLVTS